MDVWFNVAIDPYMNLVPNTYLVPIKIKISRDKNGKNQTVVAYTLHVNIMESIFMAIMRKMVIEMFLREPDMEIIL